MGRGGRKKENSGRGYPGMMRPVRTAPHPDPHPERGEGDRSLTGRSLTSWRRSLQPRPIGERSAAGRVRGAQGQGRPGPHPERGEGDHSLARSVRWTRELSSRRVHHCDACLLRSATELLGLMSFMTSRTAVSS